MSKVKTDRFAGFSKDEKHFILRAIAAYGQAINYFGANTKGTPLKLLDEIAASLGIDTP